MSEEFSGKQIQILEAAERLFSTRGFVGSSVRDIAHEAGVNVAMIAYYFGSKEKLLLSVFHHRIASSRIALEHLLADKNMGPIEKMEVFIEGVVDRMLKHKDFHRVLLNAQLTSGNEELAGIIADSKMKNLELVQQLIAQGQREKIFQRGVNAPLLMLSVTGTIYQVATGSAYLKVAFPKGDKSDEAYEAELREALKKHLKRTIKAALLYEGK
ncbi:MAG: TetR/AcrR family transcriptional regulator [Bacteroidetes bacterium]|nr:TetR/AcrR family transcriptional regulator [Bacteroidota bacterium]MBS1629128.1 TetR/AcrR family transcriptional regulator [Bacteroidota bacterium]